MTKVATQAWTLRIDQFIELLFRGNIENKIKINKWRLIKFVLPKILPVEIRFQDFRDLQGKFDRIVSIGMFEHVGKKNYRIFKTSNYCNMFQLINGNI